MKADIQTLVSQRFVENYPRFYRLAYRYLGQEADAQDAVQEAAYKAILKCRSLRSPEWIDTWLYRIVINESLSILRKRSRQTDGDAVLDQLPAREQFQDLDLQIGSVHIRLGAVQFRKNVVDFILISNYSTGTIFAKAVGNGKQINVQSACHLADFSDDRVCFL